MTIASIPEGSIAKLVERLSKNEVPKPYHIHNWTAGEMCRAVLLHMADLGIVSWEEHRHGGDVWTFEGVKYGRTD